MDADSIHSNRVRPSLNRDGLSRLKTCKRVARVTRYHCPVQPPWGDAMIVKQIWTANAYRNFNYLIACDETGEALAVDPLDHEKCLGAAKEEGWTITQIL